MTYPNTASRSFVPEYSTIEAIRVRTVWKESRRERPRLHHKGRNKHHFEYWCDYDLENVHRMIGCRMPYRYVAEMFCDRIAASKNYLGEEYTDDRPYLYYEKMIGTPLIHEKTREELEFLLRLLKEKGQEEAFSYLRKEIKRRRKEKEFF